MTGALRVRGSGTLTLGGGVTRDFGSNRIVVGDSGTSGRVVQNDGLVQNTDYLMIGGNAVSNASGEYVINGGTLSIGNGIYFAWTSTSNTGTLTQNGGLVQTLNSTQALQMGNDGGQATYNLNGGTLYSDFGGGASYPSQTFNFGGGLFRAFDNTAPLATMTTTIAPSATAFINTNGHSVTWNGPISGASAAGLTESGAGNLVLNGNNTYSGVTTVNPGSNLTLGNSAALIGSTLNTNGSIFFSLISNASFGGLAGTANLPLPAGFSLSVGSNNASTTYSGNISGGSASFTKTGAGSLTLNGTQSYTGATTVNAGKLYINGPLSTSSAVSVSSSATFGGGGSAGTVTVASGGAIEGGQAGVGSLTLNGDLTFNGAGALNLANIAGAASIVNVNGNLTASGSTGSLVINIGGTAPGNYRQL